MTDYWTFGKGACEAYKVGPVTFNGNRSYAEDAKGEIYPASKLFATQREAVKAAAAYLDAKQKEIDILQARVDRRRKFIQQQLRVCL